MRVEFINWTGGRMFVDESRVEEYKAAGYVLAASVCDSQNIQEEIPQKETKRTAGRKKKV